MGGREDPLVRDQDAGAVEDLLRTPKKGGQERPISWLRRHTTHDPQGPPTFRVSLSYLAAPCKRISTQRLRQFSIPVEFTVVVASKIDGRIDFVVARPEILQHVLGAPALVLPPGVGGLYVDQVAVGFHAPHQSALARSATKEKEVVVGFREWVPYRDHPPHLNCFEG